MSGRCEGTQTRQVAVERRRALSLFFFSLPGRLDPHASPPPLLPGGGPASPSTPLGLAQRFGGDHHDDHADSDGGQSDGGTDRRGELFERVQRGLVEGGRLDASLAEQVARGALGAGEVHECGWSCGEEEGKKGFSRGRVESNATDGARA